MNLLLLVLLITLFVLSNTHSSPEPTGSIQEDYQKIADLIIATAMEKSNLTKLYYLCDHFGNRFAGSQRLKDATAWIVNTMKHENLSVETQDITWNQWFRGEEWATMLTPFEKKLSILGFGNTVPSGGVITGKVLVVNNFTELQDRAAEAKGKIILFNVPFTTYGETVQYRAYGAIEAAKVGGIASLVRSVASYSLYTPHTGMTNYDDNVPAIPTFALTVEDAAMMGRLAGYGDEITIQFSIESSRMEATGQNILATVEGREFPKSVSAFGGHIDSWDVGSGAIDDAGGFFSTWEAVKILNELIESGAIERPRRSVRSIGWLNEENGSEGANYYFDSTKEEEEQVLVGESDYGNFKPVEIGFTGSQKGFSVFKQVVDLLSVFNLTTVYGDGNTTDNRMWCAQGLPCASLLSSGTSSDDEMYFWFHHSNADTSDKLVAEGLRESIASIAVVLYVTADMPLSLNLLK
eukprot:TRINITY_DN824_c0_g1_i6.p1 TRINITY_DN824_c0_g1~~TRINITY_DN824_c0_g1_i6.p1  ORF type:complete len:465 (-),score=125.92 TRINITY_DN824_c0_g1_i6:96-1490(-)